MSEISGKKANKWTIVFWTVVETSIPGINTPLNKWEWFCASRLPAKVSWSVKEAFELYLADDKPCYVPRYTLKFTEWIKEIKAIDGVIIWAHPLYGHQKDLENLKLIANDFLSHKIDGFELVYNYRDEGNSLPNQFIKEGTKFLMDMKESENLLSTAGSDFHGDRGNFGSVSLDVDDWENFLDVLKYS